MTCLILLRVVPLDYLKQRNGFDPQPQVTYLLYQFAENIYILESEERF